MKKLSTYLLTFFMIMFWGFRVILSFTISMGMDMEIPVGNINIEIVLLFITIIYIVLVIKRKLIGAILYMITYGAYFGPTLVSNIIAMIDGSITTNGYIACMIAFLGVVIAVAILFDMLFDRNRMAHPTDKKTDWFYKGKQYDRQMDERADKNNYKTL